MIEKDERFTLAERYVEETGVSVFLTGKAGTGKTTFLKEIVRQTSKRFAVVAPTGVAAINAGGVTIHSFFQLPLCPYLPDVKELVTEYQMPERMRSLRKERVKILRTLDLLIIDEISMVRADILDAIDDILKRYRRNDKPFGGVQVLMIGDIQQLPPVVRESERPYMEQVYSSPFFFNSKVLQRLPYVTIQLEKVHRQSDKIFLDILNEVRSGMPSDAALNELNKRLSPGFRPPENERWIRLTTHNAQADSVNEAKMNALQTDESTFEAQVEGIFPENAYPAETKLRLKEGAQVMFVRNDTSGEARYYNGKIATVEKVKPQLIVKDETGESIVVTTEKWENIRYGLNEETGEIEGIVDGTFEQVPLRLAWAVTIHKSQGLTFDHVIIDAGAAFSFGQVYVALSRCRTLEGIVLTTPITRRCTFTSEEVAMFESSREPADEVRLKLSAMSNEYFTSTLCDAFDLQRLRYLYNRVNRIYQVNLSNLYPDQAGRFNTVGAGNSALAGLLAGESGNSKESVPKTFAGIRFLSDTAQKFQKQIRHIASTVYSGAVEDSPLLRERVTKACEYFRKELRPLALFAAPLTLIEIDDKEVKKAFKSASEEFLSELRFRLALYETVLSDGFSTKAYHKLKTDNELSEERSLKALVRSLISPQNKASDSEKSLRHFDKLSTPQAQRPEGQHNQRPERQSVGEPAEPSGPRKVQRHNADGEPAEPSDLQQAQVPDGDQSTYTDSQHPELVQALIDWRREKYQKENVPAYIILHQKTLMAIADLAPTTKEELLAVKGLGKSKCDKYGDEILEIVRKAIKTIS